MDELHRRLDSDPPFRRSREFDFAIDVLIDGLTNAARLEG
jgi:hypothetical protein